MNRPRRTTRKATKIIKEDTIHLEEPKQIDFFSTIRKEPHVELSSDSEHSDYGRKATKRTRITNGNTKKQKVKKTNKRSRGTKGKLPTLPDLSSSDQGLDGSDEELGLFHKPAQKKTLPQPRATVLPHLIRIQIPPGLTTIDLNLADLLRQTKSSSFTREDELDDTLVITREHSAAKTGSDDGSTPEVISFLDLEPELRNRIYRDVLVSSSAVRFVGPSDNPKTGALLRVCRQIYHEARGVLYGENAFHLCRKTTARGTYFQPKWNEVGYKDVRRFLETIGQHNIALIRYLSIQFEDIICTHVMQTHDGGRRFTTDPVVHRICDLIAQSGAIFEKFVVGFTSRLNLTEDDYHFIKAFSDIRCHRLVVTCAFGHTRVDVELAKKLKEYMTVPKSDGVDNSKIKNIPRMAHELALSPCLHTRGLDDERS